VRNANDGLSALQIVDGGLNNVSKILDRLKTLATQSASSTFTGDRNTLNNEYSSLLSEIDRQANNIGLVEGGRYNSTLSVYIGGGSTAANAKVEVNLSGSANRVDSGGLGVGATNIVGSSAGFATNANLLTESGLYLASSAASHQDFVFSSYAGGDTTFTVSITGATDGITANQALSQLNSQLTSRNIQAVIGSDNKLAFTGTVAFSVSASTVVGTAGLVTDTASAINTTLYNVKNAQVGFTGGISTAGQTLSLEFSNANGTATLVLTSGNAATDTLAIAAINNATKALGIYAITDIGAGTQTQAITVQSALDFSIKSLGATSGAAANDSIIFGFGTSAAVGTPMAATWVNDAASSTTANATVALGQITKAVAALGQVQGKIGSAQNKLSYAIQLAQSQVSAFSAAESRIRDADVASEAANLTKAQVLQQASIAAMAQANSAPQAVLSLLRG
jgi:flagellin